MRLKGLFIANKVVIIPVTNESVGSMMRQIKSYAFEQRMTIKTECGIFVKQDTMQVEKVIRCEVIANPEHKLQKKEATKIENQARKEKIKRLGKEKEERNKKIIDDHKNGLSVRDLSIKYKMSRQGIYNILKKELEL